MDARRDTTVRRTKQVRGYKVRMVKRPQESFTWSMRLNSLYEQVALRNEVGKVAIDDCVWERMYYFPANKDVGDSFWYEIKSSKEFTYNLQILRSNFLSSEIEVSVD